MTLILYGIYIGVQFLLCFLIYPKSNSDFIGYIGYGIFSCSVLFFTVTVLSNPGIPSEEYHLTKAIYEKINKKNEGSDNITYKICFECNVYTDKNANVGHCLTCKLCIIGHDHHCSWSSKCIGKGNLLWFRLFVSSLALFFLYAIFCLIYVNIDHK